MPIGGMDENLVQEKKRLGGYVCPCYPHFETTIQTTAATIKPKIMAEAR